MDSLAVYQFIRTIKVFGTNSWSLNTTQGIFEGNTKIYTSHFKVEQKYDPFDNVRAIYSIKESLLLKNVYFFSILYQNSFPDTFCKNTIPALDFTNISSKVSLLVSLLGKIYFQKHRMIQK